MTLYHALQLVVAAWVLAVVWERIRTLFYGAALEAQPFHRAAVQTIQARHWEDASALAKAGWPAWIAQVLHAAVEPMRHEAPVSPALDALLAELRFEAERGLRTLRVLASIGSSGGMLGAVVEIVRFMGGDHGVRGLMAGAVETQAFERALLSLTIGMSTALVALACRQNIARQARRLFQESTDLAGAIERSVHEGRSR